MKALAFAALACACLCARSAAADDTVTLAFVGDVMLDGGPGRSIEAGVDPFARFADEFARADAVIGNLECAVATGGAPVDKVFTFRAHPRVVPVLARHFSAVSLANNHSGDYGAGALLETMSLLEQSKLPFFGAGRDLEAAHRALFLERRGVRIALLGYDEFLPRRFEAGATRPGVAWSEDEDVVRDIRAARRAGADIVIPFMHWGWEYEPGPSARQRELAHRMLDAGADAVVGSHPHVTQGAEYYRGKPIVYSLGNFVFDGFDAPEARLGWLLELELTKSRVVGFRTESARIDENGLPAPEPATPSPCGEHGVIHPCGK
ncbi:MAG TPA: CapA family protein [Polyangiaceae bacterium]|nr:CapA family protein [Polyangiaceae bacterium]